MAAGASRRLRVLLLLLIALHCSHAKKGRPVRRPAKSSGGGFGRAARTPASKPAGFGPAARAPVVPPKPRSSLETKLLQEHTTNCAMAKQTFAVCADDAGAACHGWAAKGECVRNAAFMSTSCRLACGKCVKR